MLHRRSVRTGDQALVREINLSLIMNCLHQRAPISRADLAEITGLNKSTVSSLVTELIERRFVREVGITSGSVGRPSVQLELNPQAGYIVSAEIGVGFVSVFCTNFKAELLWRYRESFAVEAPHSAILSRTLNLIDEAVAEGRDQLPTRQLLGIAVGVPGLIDQHDGTLLFAPNLRWRDVPLRPMLQAAYPNVQITVDNEANLAALGECIFGAGQHYREVLYISAGVGVGGAIVQDGQIFRGTAGFAGELGHMTMLPDGELCSCGNRGCWETLVSQGAILRAVRRALDEGNPSLLAALPLELTLQDVIEAARDGDGLALTILTRAGRDLGLGIASLINVLNPDLVLIGGMISFADEFILPPIMAEIQQRAFAWSVKATTVAVAEYALNACVMGGVAAVYQAVLSQPTTY